MRSERGGVEQTRDNGICRQTDQGAETIIRGWRVGGVGKFQVGGIPLQEIRWGADGIERFYDDEMILMGRR